ncbi:MAG: hypothetical protein WB816_12270 [Methylocystis sp.]
MFSEPIIPLCPAVIRCALMLVGGVSILLFKGALLQFVISAGTF